MLSVCNDYGRSQKAQSLSIEINSTIDDCMPACSHSKCLFDLRLTSRQHLERQGLRLNMNKCRLIQIAGRVFYPVFHL